MLAQLQRFDDLEKYLRYLGRLSLYTRTRMDYEQTISQLTPEQEQAVSDVKLKKDYLIKGGAGTGKSLVLIECLRRAIIQDEFDFGKNEKVVLVTFTRTLAKYNSYIAGIKGMDLPLDIISTVDTLFFEKLRKLYPDFSYDFGLLEKYFTEDNVPDFLTPEELISEIENFLFANGITEEEYLDKLISRSGMRHRLSKQQRRVVWGMRDYLIDYMEAHNVYTKNYGRYKLWSYLKNNPTDKSIRDISYLFLDEVQDLTPVALKILRELTRSSIIMAGDTDQSLYNFQSPFARAKIKLRGRTRILKTNFRNTRQIHTLAENFRKSRQRDDWDNYAEAFTFREGPVPELYITKSTDKLQKLLVEKIGIFVEDLGYDPENICILVPRNNDIGDMTEYMQTNSYDAVNINSDDFTFKDTGKIRVSTLHSSKGLDLPVVLLYLPYLHRRKQYDDEQTEKLLRNLVYVAITRAMDNLNVFTSDTNDPVVKDVIKSFQQKMHQT